MSKNIISYLIVKTKKSHYNVKMEIFLYNTLSHKRDLFTPINPGKISMYSCGPTVYDTPHIGNYRTFVMVDLLRRMFEYNNYEVDSVMNITDVDDKTIRKSHEENQQLSKVTKKYEDLFFEGLSSLNILKPKHILRATKNIPSMIDLISTLLEKGVAYKASDGIYMSISKVKNYGELAHIKISDNHSTKERISNDEYDKDNPHDFVLWKFHTQNDGNVSWNTPFGNGRPGWHVECSAMAMKALGPTIDIHTGATDLIFPHHTNEIAQSESATDKKFVNYWIHGGFMNIHDEKMSKSKGNFTKLEDLENETLSALTFRYWLLTAHYRSVVNFSYEAIRGAQNALIRLLSTIGNLPEGGKIDQEYKNRFQIFINDDLDMPKALALSWELLKDSKVTDADKKATLLDFDRVFGLKLAAIPFSQDEAPEIIPTEIQALADAREEARGQKDWIKADALRGEIESRGYGLKDTENGVKVYEI